MTTTSLRAPLLARGALRLRACIFRSLHMSSAPVPTNATTAAVMARFLDIQRWTSCR